MKVPSHPLLGLLPLFVLTAACAGPRREYLPAENALGPYSGSVVAGHLCFVSGKIGQRGEGFEHEVQTAIDAVEAELARSGLVLTDVVSATVYLTDLGRYAELNEIYARRFREDFPARACIGVAALPADAQVEIAVIALRP